MRLCDAIAVTAIARDSAAVAAGAPYRVLAQLAPALAADAGVGLDVVMAMSVKDVSTLANGWAAARGLGEDLADTLALAWPRAAADADQS